MPSPANLAELFEADGHKLVLLPEDLTDPNFCVEMVAETEAALGGLDLSVNNTAYQQSKASIEDISFDQFDQTMKTNLYAMFWITKTAAPLMKPGSAIINTTSVNSVDPGEELLDYATTKAGIAIFTKGLAKQLAKKSIRVTGPRRDLSGHRYSLLVDSHRAHSASSDRAHLWAARDNQQNWRASTSLSPAPN